MSDDELVSDFKFERSQVLRKFFYKPILDTFLEEQEPVQLSFDEV